MQRAECYAAKFMLHFPFFVENIFLCTLSCLDQGYCEAVTTILACKGFAALGPDLMGLEQSTAAEADEEREALDTLEAGTSRSALKQQSQN